MQDKEEVVSTKEQQESIEIQPSHLIHIVINDVLYQIEFWYSLNKAKCGEYPIHILKYKEINGINTWSNID